MVPTAKSVVAKIGKVEYKIVDFSQTISEKDWYHLGGGVGADISRDRVIAMVVLGNTWQFNSLPEKDPAKVFSKGVYGSLDPG